MVVETHVQLLVAQVAVLLLCLLTRLLWIQEQFTKAVERLLLLFTSNSLLCRVAQSKLQLVKLLLFKKQFNRSAHLMVQTVVQL